ncbi:MAG: hypothetical protein KZQ77_02075 [Candidatus Thiodiazotropha sp. (ex Notomyrtea botanica)]|nr:hypothetical protein [Candidatus Thiodiazotropha sp. (ex Notomyrtea botanica)]
MSTEVWKFITEQVALLKSARLHDMQLLAKQCETEVLSELRGYKVIVKPEYLLNGDLIIRVEASRKRIFGFVTQSISGGFEVSVEGKVTDYDKPIRVTERTATRERWEAMANS